jgi:hypothetical protein
LVVATAERLSVPTVIGEFTNESAVLVNHADVCVGHEQRDAGAGRFRCELRNTGSAPLDWMR